MHKELPEQPLESSGEQSNKIKEQLEELKPELEEVAEKLKNVDPSKVAPEQLRELKDRVGMISGIAVILVGVEITRLGNWIMPDYGGGIDTYGGAAIAVVGILTILIGLSEMILNAQAPTAAKDKAVKSKPTPQN